jgi:N-acetylglucosamine kinase-like BadF-type ATPase
LKIFAGIDGGGTRTRLALANEDGKLLGCAAGASCSFVDHGIQKAQAELGNLWCAAWRNAGMRPRLADAVFLGVGSILSIQDTQANCELAAKIGLADVTAVFAGNDVWNAHAGSFSGQPGIVLVSGTGSVCFGRNAQRESWRAGGWGHLLNEQGSAYALGQAALVAATRAADQRGAATALNALVCEVLSLQDLKDIFRKLHYTGVSRAEVAALAPRVVALAEQGDVVAREILVKEADGFVEMVVTVARQLQMTSPDLALTGGLITNASLFRRIFLNALASKLPGFQLVEHGMAPVLGAVLLAFEHSTGKVPSKSFRQRLMASCKNCSILE